MNKLKCRRCGLVNASTDTSCRRCGEETGGRRISSNARQSPREAAKKSSWIYTLLFLAVVISAASYLFKGFEKSYDEVNANELNRPQSQPKPKTDGHGPRAEEEQKRTGAYKNAVQKSSGLAESQKHVDETNKLMPAEPDKAKK